MKTLTCAQMGGPCQASISGANLEEISKNGMQHLQQAHPDMVDKMKDMTPEQLEAWNKSTQALLDAQPEA